MASLGPRARGRVVIHQTAGGIIRDLVMSAHDAKDYASIIDESIDEIIDVNFD